MLALLGAPLSLAAPAAPGTPRTRYQALFNIIRLSKIA